MNRKVLFIISVTLFAFVNLSAQRNPDAYKKGYQFSVKIKGIQNDTLYFGNYFANQQYSIDTAILDKKGVFKFKNDDKEMFPGMYFFVTPEGKYFEVIIDPVKENLNFEIETSEANLVMELKVKGSAQNKLFYDYNKYNQGMYLKLDSIKKADNLSDEDFKKLRTDFGKMVDSNKVLFMEQNPDHFLTKMLNATKEIDLPDSPKDENGKYIDTTFIDYLRMYYREHYFDNMPLDWDGLVRTPKAVFYDRLDGYFEHVLKYMPADSIIKYVDLLIEKTRPSKEVFKYVVWYLSDKYLKSNILGYDAVYVHMIERYYMSGDAFWVSPSAIEEEGKRAMKWKNLLIGKTAPELITKDLDGKWISLHGLKNKFTILVFWSPDCGHCRTEIPALHEFYKNNREKYDIEVYAVNTEFQDDDKWKEFLKKNNIDLWINTSGGEANIDWREVYDVFKTPIIYLLDEDKRILGKQLSQEALEIIIKDVLAGKKMF
ncbi:redoxin domain-containing protein [Bacteroidales bacterium OttesenSCG-928-C19]|nr:redoxin domain-containing protein [Bacteroidales bacterium OttesenSCG-928-C19]